MLIIRCTLDDVPYGVWHKEQDARLAAARLESVSDTLLALSDLEDVFECDFNSPVCLTLLSFNGNYPVKTEVLVSYDD